MGAGDSCSESSVLIAGRTLVPIFHVLELFITGACGSSGLLYISTNPLEKISGGGGANLCFFINYYYLENR